jgi:hypothetical protein
VVLGNKRKVEVTAEQMAEHYRGQEEIRRRHAAMVARAQQNYNDSIERDVYILDKATQPYAPAEYNALKGRLYEAQMVANEKAFRRGGSLISQLVKQAWPYRASSQGVKDAHQAELGAMRDAASIQFYYPHRGDRSR